MNNSSLAISSVQFSSLQLLSHVRLFATPWIAARQASLSITNSRTSLKLTSIESVMPSSHLILCCPFFSCPQSLPASESFPMSQLFAWGGQSTGVSALASFLPKNTQGWSPLERTGWISLQSKGLLKGCCWITWIHRDSWPPEEKNSIRGQRRGLIAQSFCVIKFY